MSAHVLDAVTLVAIDTRTPQAAVESMLRCMKELQFAEAILVTVDGYQVPEGSGIRISHVPAITTSRGYSEFVVHNLPELIKTSHVLIVQWDGFVTHPQAWEPAFLDFDYIGAPWPQFHDAFDVGNGGFSLRSHRLMTAAKQVAMGDVHPEDIWLCRTMRPYLEGQQGLCFAPREVAQRFSCERSGDVTRAFGCHGLSNMVDALPLDELGPFLLGLPVDVYASTECRRLVKKLTGHARWDLARHALRARRKLCGWQLSDMRLWLRLYGAQLLHRAAFAIK